MTKEKCYIMELESLDKDYIDKVKAFIKGRFPHIESGLFKEPSERWKTLLRDYQYNTIEVFLDIDFLFYGHGDKYMKHYDATQIFFDSVIIGEL